MSAPVTTAPEVARRSGLRRSLALGLVGLLVGTSLGLLLGLRGPELGQRTTGDTALAADVRAAFTTDRGFTSLSAARIRGGQVTYAGLGDAGTGPPGPDTPYELGSITKTFTAALLADAVHRGEVGLDDQVSTHLGELAGTAVGRSTLRALATHTAGLPPFPSSGPVTFRVLGNENPYAGSVADLLEATRSTRVSKPGVYRYSNLGVALLGHALARAAHTADWPTLVGQRILDPLGMRHTVVVQDPARVPAGTAQPHHDNGWRAPVWTGPAFAPAGSSTVTTTADLATWASALLDGSAPGSAAMDPLTDIPGGQIGLVWHVREVDGRTITWHNGATGGTRTILALDRQRGQAVLLLSSTARDADSAGLHLAATSPGAPTTFVDRPATSWPGLVGWSAVGLLLLGTAVRRWRLGGGWALIEGALAAVTGLLVLLVHGPWQLVPTALWAGLALALLALGVDAVRHPGPGRTTTMRASVTSLASTTVLLALTLWTS